MPNTLEINDPVAAFAQTRARRDQIRAQRRHLEQEVERLQARARTADVGDQGADYVERVLRGEPVGDIAAPGQRITGIAEELGQAKRQLAIVVEAHCRFQPEFERAEAEAKAWASRQLLDQHREILRRQAEHVLALADLATAESELISALTDQRLYAPGVLPQLSFPGCGRGRDSLLERWLARLQRHGVEVEG